MSVRPVPLAGAWRARAARVPALVLLCAVSSSSCSADTRVALLNSEPDGAVSRPANSSHLLHRYSFSGEGTRVADLVGEAHGSLQNGALLDGAGHAALDGVDDYVNLPNGLVSSLSNGTVFAWLSWNGGPCWQRVFDFGSSDAGEDAVGNSTSSVFATPLRCPGAGPATSIETSAGRLASIDSDSPFPVLRETSLAVVFDVSGRELRLYVGGVPLGIGQLAGLSQINDVNAWLGRSQWVQDRFLRGIYDEFRIYDVALDSAAVAAIDAAGPDALDASP